MSKNDEGNSGEEPLIYELSPKHHANTGGYVTPAPIDGQAVLEASIPVSGSTVRRIGVDWEQEAFILFEPTHPGKRVYHGYVRPWERMTARMRTTLIRAGLASKRGRLRRPS